MPEFPCTSDGHAKTAQAPHTGTPIIGNIREFAGKTPDLAGAGFIAPTAIIIGDVKVGPGTSIWDGVTIRGDIQAIQIGTDTNIQELTVIHVDLPNANANANAEHDKDGATLIGDRVTVGHRALLHACVIEDDCLIGMGAIILSGARIGRGSIVAAGALVREGQVVPPGTLVAGLPAQPKGEVSPAWSEKIRLSAEHYAELGRAHAAQYCVKPHKQ